MRGLGILILVVVFFWLVWPVISRWLKQKAMERAEDYMRSTMGMPPRDKKKGKKQEENSRKETYYHRSRRHPFETQEKDGPIIPKEYAEDVEFTETIDYSRAEYKEAAKGKAIYHESQVSDVEYVEIKKDRSK